MAHRSALASSSRPRDRARPVCTEYVASAGSLVSALVWAQFVLRAFGRFERVARAIHADGRRKRLAGAEVRRQAVVGQVHQAHAAGRGAVAKTRRGAVGVVLLVGVRPILAAAQHQHPFVLDLDLVLQIQAQRIGTRIDAVVGGGVQHRHRAVHGVPLR
ncbi:hypothetical protein G6F31_018986 [Rhizopus arrhizus]|nr:hypothetical protein G6F31_018986 [Rhizopus arrhizus]